MPLVAPETLPQGGGIEALPRRCRSAINIKLYFRRTEIWLNISVFSEKTIQNPRFLFGKISMLFAFSGMFSDFVRSVLYGHMTI